MSVLVISTYSRVACASGSICPLLPFLSTLSIVKPYANTLSIIQLEKPFALH